MADGIAILGDIIKYHYYCLFRLMLLPFNSIGRCYGQWIVADDMPLRLMLLPIVYWFNILADVIAIIVADVITTFYLFCFWLMLLPMFLWQMLLPLRLMLLPAMILFWLMLLPNLYVADVIATEADVIAYKMVFWLMLLPISGRCYNHYIECVGWWYCQVADGMATVGWRMVSGWCYYPRADVIALGQCLFYISM